MCKIEHIIEQIHWELETADDYVDCACDSKSKEQDMYIALAEDEIEHAEKLMSFLSNTERDERWTTIWEYEEHKLNKKLLKLKSHLSQL